MNLRAQRILDFLTEYGPSTINVLDLAMNPNGEDPEGMLQLLHYLEDMHFILAVTAFSTEPVRPVTILERI
jgi:hypothetical protein